MSSRYTAKKVLTVAVVSSSTASSPRCMTWTELGMMMRPSVRFAVLSSIISLEIFIPPPVEPDMGPTIISSMSSDSASCDHTEESTAVCAVVLIMELTSNSV